jgi:hypothetical protein
LFWRARVRPGGTGAESGAAAEAKVTIRAVPDGAKIFFDDAPLQGNPATATFNRDGLAHKVRAEAPDYGRKTELVVLDSSNVSVEIELTKGGSDDVDPFGNKLTALTVKVAPPGARIYLDKMLLPTNPSTAKYPRDGKQHEVKAEAVGFLPKTQTLAFEGAQASVNLTLDKDPKYVPPRGPPGKRGAAAAAPPPEAAAAPPPPPAAPAAPENPAPKSTGKSLDRGDPWAK